MKFLKRIDAFVSRKNHVLKNALFTQLAWTRPSGEESYKARAFERIIKKQILKVLGPSFNKIKVFKRKAYNQEAINNFVDMMNLQISNRRSIGFSSVKSFVMSFEVLQVTEIGSDDYKNLILDAVEKVKVLSERSFEMDNLSGFVDENAKNAFIENFYVNQSINILEPSAVRETSQMLQKKMTFIDNSMLKNK